MGLRPTDANEKPGLSSRAERSEVEGSLPSANRPVSPGFSTELAEGSGARSRSRGDLRAFEPAAETLSDPERNRRESKGTCCSFVGSSRAEPAERAESKSLS